MRVPSSGPPLISFDKILPLLGRGMGCACDQNTLTYVCCALAAVVCNQFWNI